MKIIKTVEDAWMAHEGGYTYDFADDLDEDFRWAIVHAICESERHKKTTTTGFGHSLYRFTENFREEFHRRIGKKPADKKQFQKTDNCPYCGSIGQWIRAALVCADHGPWAGV